MNKKIILGSITSVVILVIVSFTSIGGYGSDESKMNLSPLFNIRITRAIQRDGEDLVCDYVGKGEDNVLSIPKKNTQQYKIGKLINIIRNMNDKTYDRFVDIVKNANFNYNNKKNDEKIKVLPAPATIHFLRPICLTLYFFIAIPIAILITVIFNIDIICELAELPTFY
jgi:hypothetical protein